MYGKLIEGVLIEAPRNYVLEDGRVIANFNKNEILLKQYAFKEIIDVIPSYNEEIQYVEILSYTETDTNITINYNILDKQPTIDDMIEQIDIAYDHSQSTHAPSDAQKNSDITKAEIEFKLTGDITSHTHNYVDKSTGNANQIIFADGETFQSKLDNGILKGDTGEQGIQGEKGEKGEKGDIGEIGARGEKGEDGTDGVTFTPNVDATGDLSWSNNGNLANPTTVNIKGEKGDTGATPTISIGTVSTLDPSTSATASITGTTPNLVLNLGIPRGATGSSGSDNESSAGKWIVSVAEDVYTLTFDKYQFIQPQYESTTIVVPNISETDVAYELHLMTSGGAGLSFVFSGNIYWQNSLVFETTGVYEFIFTSVMGVWLAGCIVYPMTE